MDSGQKHCLVIVAFCMFAVGPAASAGTFPFAHEQQTLPNGLKTIVVPLDTPGLVTYFSIGAAPAAATKLSPAARAMRTSSST